MDRIHIMGAPGAGVSTLGRALAERLGCTHFDVDDYEWFTDDPLPYRRKRNPDHRRQLLTPDLADTQQWVLSGSLCGWGDVFMPQFDVVVYCWLPAEVRLARIRAREIARYGEERLDPGGDLAGVFEKFLLWAADYDLPTGRLRSREKEVEWLTGLGCPVLKLEQEEALEEWMRKVEKEKSK